MDLGNTNGLFIDVRFSDDHFFHLFKNIKLSKSS